jgi:hypothetical protein
MSSNENQIIRVTVIGENDIVCGRGGAALRHPGNLAYRKIVNINKTLYATCLKAEKLRISKSIVAAIREINGRFLEREDGKIPTTLEDQNPDGTPVTWCDIGDRRAIEKTSQALREGQPKLLKKLKDSGELSPMNEKHENQGYHMSCSLRIDPRRLFLPTTHREWNAMRITRTPMPFRVSVRICHESLHQAQLDWMD